MKPLGMVLVVLGVPALIYGGVSWTRKDTVVDAGPIQITADKKEERLVRLVLAVDGRSAH